MSEAKTILIVDDEPHTRQGLQNLLTTWAVGRYDIVIAEDADEALLLLGQNYVQLLITDIRMPEINGLQLVNTLKRLHRQPAVIILSGYSEFNYAQEAIRLGVANYLLKPVKRQKLIEAVELALQLHEKSELANRMKKVVDLTLLQTDDHQVPLPVQVAKEYVRDHLRRSSLSLREVADYIHLNSSYFSVLFKEKTGMTFSEYVTRSRLQQAKNLLMTTQLPIADIAEEVGYQTVKYFMTLFKEHEGLTPSQYRKQMGEKYLT